MRRALGAVALAFAIALFGPAAGALAAPPCGTVPVAKTLVERHSTLESITSGPDGKLYFTDAGAGQLLVLDKPGAEPRVLAQGIDSPGGLAFEKGGSLLVGYGDAIATGVQGNLIPMAGALRVNVKTGDSEPAIAGLAMANGLALGPDGTLYASDDVGIGIDRVVDGAVENRWASVVSSNGLVVDRAGENLYANQTFQPAAIVKIPLDDPGAASTYVRAAVGDIAAGPDGLTRDGLDRLYVAANSGGQIWRVNRHKQICSLAETAPLGPSAVSFGHGRNGPFPRTNLYFVSFGGQLVELRKVLRGKPPIACGAARARMRRPVSPLSASPSGRSSSGTSLRSCRRSARYQSRPPGSGACRRGGACNASATCTAETASNRSCTGTLPLHRLRI